MKILIITLITILLFSFINCQQDQSNCTPISTCAELSSISGNTCYRLTNDIDCWSVQPFTPVSSFSGILYGNRFRVRNLIVFTSYAGLFSNLAGGASIWDLEIENSVFRGAYAAPFAAVITSTGSSLNVPVNMLNCISRNNTIVSNTTSSLASGLVAYVNFPLIMRGCSTIYNMISAYTFSPSPNLILSSYAAGLVSYSDSTLSMYECSSTLNNIISVSNSSVDSVSSDSTFAGGLVGYNLAGDTLITECMSGHNYIYAYSNQSFLDNKMIAFSGGICGICYGTISNSVSSLNGIKTYLHPSILSNYTSSVGGISGFAYLTNTTYLNSVSRLNILRSDNSTGACECYFLFGTGCVSTCTTPTNIVTSTF